MPTETGISFTANSAVVNRADDSVQILGKTTVNPATAAFIPSWINGPNGIPANRRGISVALHPE